MNPKVFVSHASEDKSRFVTVFAKRLRDKGIDAWLDNWEMLPGDSLVDKIFEEGLKNAEAVIIVLSNDSIKKPWVIEELNASVINKISKNTKIIPVIIDSCEVPESLKSTVWIKIKDLNNYEVEFNEIVKSIFNKYEKPTLGKLPQYIVSDVMPVEGLEKTDTIIFNFSCEKALEKSDINVSSEELYEIVEKYEITKEDFQESLSILDSRSYIEASKSIITGHIPFYKISHFGLNEFLKMKYNDYTLYEKEVALKIVNEEFKNSTELAENMQLPNLVIANILEDFSNRGLIKIQKSIQNIVFITSIEVELKRILRNSW